MSSERKILDGASLDDTENKDFTYCAVEVPKIGANDLLDIFNTNNTNKTLDTILTSLNDNDPEHPSLSEHKTLRRAQSQVIGMNQSPVLQTIFLIVKVDTEKFKNKKVAFEDISTIYPALNSPIIRDITRIEYNKYNNTHEESIVGKLFPTKEQREQQQKEFLYNLYNEIQTSGFKNPDFLTREEREERKKIDEEVNKPIPLT